MPTHISGELLPVDNPEKSIQNYELVVGGQAMNISSDYMRGISVSYNEKTSFLTVRSSVLETAQYLRFDTSSKSGSNTYTIIDMDKKTYQATIDW